MEKELSNDKRTSLAERFLKRKKIEKVYPPELEGLKLVPKFKSSGKRGEDLFFGIDVGSTNTRVTFISPTYYCSMDNSDAELDYINIPTTMSVDYNINPKSPTFIYADSSNLSEELYENMDSIIDLVITGNPNDDNSFTRGMRIVRGGKQSQYQFEEESILNQCKKTDTKSYMATIIDSIGYSVLYKYSEEGKDLPLEFNAYVGLSVRPEEATSDQISDLKKAICHEYNWTCLAYNCSIKIRIADIFVQSEPQSLISQFYQELEVPEYVCNIMGGGSNSGTCVLENGSPITEGVNQLNMCGSIFETRLQAEINMIRNKKGLNSLDLSQQEMHRLINEGQIRIFGVDTDYKDVVLKMKKVAGKEIAQELLLKLFTNKKFQLTTMNAIVFSGNFFKRSCFIEYMNDTNPIKELELLKKEISYRRPTREEVEKARVLSERIKNERPSIADFIIEEFNKVSKGVLQVIVENNLIPLGNLNAIIDRHTEQFGEVLESLSVVYPELLEEDED